MTCEEVELMICPKCGSRDVLDSRNPQKKEISCECQNCGHQWREGYDPSCGSGRPSEVSKRQ